MAEQAYFRSFAMILYHTFLNKYILILKCFEVLETLGIKYYIFYGFFLFVIIVYVFMSQRLYLLRYGNF